MSLDLVQNTSLVKMLVEGGGVQSNTSSEMGANISVVCCVNAHAQAVPPMTFYLF